MTVLSLEEDSDLKQVNYDLPRHQHAFIILAAYNIWNSTENLLGTTEVIRVF